MRLHIGGVISDFALKQTRAVFLTVGVDTGVGKTVFSGLLGRYMINKGISLRLAKPFCSGGRGDIEFLRACGLSGESEINFWYENSSISPAAWELREGDKVDFFEVVSLLKEGEDSLAENVLLVEGVGGLLAPITSKLTVASLAQELGSNLIIIGQNRVGVINHVLLTIEAALSRGLSVSSVILMEQEEPDASAVHNAELVHMHMPDTPDFKGVFEFPWLGKEADNPELISVNVKKAESLLEKVFNEVINSFFINDSNN